MRRFALLDRDGTINVDKHYLSDPEQLELIPGSGEAIARLNQAGWGVLVVTNQSGIGRGYFDHARLDQIHTRLHELLAQHGAHVDGIEICPHAPDFDCTCRKPLPELVELAPNCTTAPARLLKVFPSMTVPLTEQSLASTWAFHTMVGLPQ